MKYIDKKMDSTENLFLKTLEYKQEKLFSTGVDDREYIPVDNVRIYPASMIFADAYDGKRFVGTLKIINSGKNIAFVRILNPTSKVKSFIL